MKKILFLFIFFALAAQAQEKRKLSLKPLYWLSGNWVRTGMNAGESGYESWQVISYKKMTGMAGNKKGGKLTFQEKMSLVIKAGEIYFVAETPGNNDATWFKLTEIGNKYFVCENPAHDFPKKIIYRLMGNKLLATISGDGKTVPFEFVRRDAYGVKR